MAYQYILYEKKGQIAYVTLNRPEAENIINQQLAQELKDVCYHINQDDDIYVVIITGAGDKAFCGGSELEQRNPDYNVATAIASINQPVIVAINGNARGEGLELALSGDIRLASFHAKFSLPQVTLGLIPRDGGTQRLSRIIGKAKALELILTADTISAVEALEIGLLNKVVTNENLTSEVEAIAKTIAGKGPIALRYAKEAVNKGMDLTLEQGLHLEANLYFLLHTTADRTEGISSFRGKKDPQFKGQ